MSHIDWPSPAEYEFPPTFDNYSAEPCVLVLGDGIKQLGNLLAFGDDQERFTFHGTQDDEPTSLATQDIQLLHLLRPVVMKHEEQAFKRNNDSAFTHAEKSRFKLEFKDGNLLTGETISMVKTSAGIYLYQPKAGNLVVRRFIASAAANRFGIRQNPPEEVVKKVWPMRNAILAAAYQSIPEKYPYELEKRYERVLNRIMEFWGTQQLDFLLEDLLVDKRGGRQGFPKEIVAELLFLGELHTRIACARADNPNDPWGIEVAKRALREMHVEVSQKRLFRAVETSDKETLALLLRAGLDVNLIGENGWTPLMMAAFNGNEDAALQLIQAGASLRVRDKNGYAPIHWAAMNGFTKVVNLLLVKGAAINVRNHFGWTALLHAASRGHVAVVDLLLLSRADTNIPDEEGWTPLHKAVANGHIVVVNKLITAGARVNARHRDGTTPLGLAISKSKAEIQALLLKHGAEQ